MGLCALRATLRSATASDGKLYFGPEQPSHGNERSPASTKSVPGRQARRAGSLREVLPPGVRGRPAERGWIGVGVDINVREATRGPATLEVRVVRTVDGGPAALVGVVPGDVIRTIDGDPITIERWQRFTQNLRPGVDLRLAVDRAGRGREVRLTTAPRPSLLPVPMGLTAYLDSVRTSFRTQLESGKGVWASRDYVTLLIAGDSVEAASTRILRQARQNAGSYGVRPGSNADILTPSGQGGNRYSVVWNTDAALPLEYLMLQSPEADSVKTAIIRLRGALTEVTEATRVREQEIRAIVELTASGWAILADRRTKRPRVYAPAKAGRV